VRSFPRRREPRKRLLWKTIKTVLFQQRNMDPHLRGDDKKSEENKEKL